MTDRIDDAIERRELSRATLPRRQRHGRLRGVPRGLRHARHAPTAPGTGRASTAGPPGDRRDDGSRNRPAGADRRRTLNFANWIGYIDVS